MYVCMYVCMYVFMYVYAEMVERSAFIPMFVSSNPVGVNFYFIFLNYNFYLNSYLLTFLLTVSRLTF